MGETTKSLHFTLDKNFGAMLLQISRDHLNTEYDYNKAFEVFSKSGAPIEYALSLMKGDKVRLAAIRARGTKSGKWKVESGELFILRFPFSTFHFPLST